MTPAQFISRWSAASASERSNSQTFLCELADLLNVERPHNNFDHGYAFEFTVTDHHHDGSTSDRRIDLYKRACFVLESKQFQAARPDPTALEQAAAAAGVLTQKKKSTPVRGTGQWDDAMTRARGQAERYVRALPASEPNPPFLIVVDVGDTIELYADFTQAGKAYLPFPDPRSFRIRLPDLSGDSVRERLRLIWTDPLSLDPARKSADVTREIASHLAELAKSLEAARHPANTVAEFLTRCLFCMFAEDVGLLPKNGFTDLLHSLPDDGAGFQAMLQQLFREMNTGTDFSTILRKKLLQFNGGLFADDTVLPLNKLQLGLLRAASKLNWRNVEPAIFGTLLERALNPHDRHKLGAHYTPRAYVERLVLPTVIEPLRAEWESVRTAALTHARLGSVDKAIKEIRDFHQHLCQVKVLDPACGSGNFLYVTLEHMKRLEGEVLLELEKYGDRELTFEMQHFSVDPHQFLGIEVNPRAASITELVLWIGYLQWHFRTRGQTMPAEPIIKKFKNIECRDAVLAWDGHPEPQRDEHGKEITVWDRRSYKKDLVTGREIPDESKRIPLLTYKNPRPAEWPEADYIVGNPPYIGPALMRDDLGDAYVTALRNTYDAIPESADYVMYWWDKAASMVRQDKAGRFGFITTNKLRQTFARRVVEPHFIGNPRISLVFAIPDHPWVDSADGADVRIAMSVATRGETHGLLCEVKDEKRSSDEVIQITLDCRSGAILPNLTIGANIAECNELKSNNGVANRGFCLFGAGFIVTPEQTKSLGLTPKSELSRYIRPYRNGRDLANRPRGVYVIDLFGLTAEEVRDQFPATYQHVLTHVKPERDSNNRETRRVNWWIFGEPNKLLRQMLRGLNRYIATVETAKHRTFQFLEASIAPDNMLVVIALDDAFHLGVLSSSVHVVYALAAGGRLGVGNDPRYNKSRCFDPFPFPDCTEPQRDRIRKIAEELDAHRKRVQAQHQGITLTGMYNVLAQLRANQPLTPKEKDIHDKALVSVLKQLHDDLDAAVFDAYGWPRSQAQAAAGAFPSDAEILERLVALNAERAREEAAGHIRWLRPDYQIPLFQKTTGGTRSTASQTSSADTAKPDSSTPELNLPIPKKKKPKKTEEKAFTLTSSNFTLTFKRKQPWPKSLPERAKAVEYMLGWYGNPATPAQIAFCFQKPRYDNIPEIQEILETLCTFGRARPGKDKNTYTT